MSEFSVNDAEAAIAEGLKKMELSPELQEDHNFIMESLPEAAIVSLTQQFLTMIIMRTAYSRVQLRIQIPEKYPVEVGPHSQQYVATFKSLHFLSASPFE